MIKLPVRHGCYIRRAYLYVEIQKTGQSQHHSDCHELRSAIPQLVCHDQFRGGGHGRQSGYQYAKSSGGVREPLGQRNQSRRVRPLELR